MDYMTLKEASEKWGVTPRQINYLCTGGLPVSLHPWESSKW